jgi:tetratricopeptide (TPR) repeat protein
MDDDSFQKRIISLFHKYIARRQNSRKKNNNRASILYTKANYEFDQNDFVDAVATLTEAIDFDPRPYGGYKFRARAYLKIFEYDLAIADFTEMIRLQPNESHAYHERAQIYFSRSSQINADAAIADYTAAIQHSKWYQAEKYWQRAMAYAYKGDYDNAIKDIEQSIG